MKQLTQKMANMVLNNLPFGVAYMDKKHIVKYFNNTSANEFHYSENSPGKSAVNCHKTENQSKVSSILDNFANKKSNKISLTYITPNSHKKLLTEYLPIYNQNSVYQGSLCVIKDITNIK
jgi:uncharacterized protein